MKVIDERILELLKSEPAGLSMEDISRRINKLFPPGYGNDLFSASLRRLSFEGAAVSPAKGMWKAVGKWAAAGVKKAPVAATPKPTAPDVAPRPPHKPPLVKQCPKCGSDDVTPKGRCRPCKKRENAEYNARKRGESPAADPLASAHEAAPRAISAPTDTPTPRASRFVQSVLMLRLKDAGGEDHDFFFTHETIRTLAIELQEYI